MDTAEQTLVLINMGYCTLSGKTNILETLKMMVRLVVEAEGPCFGARTRNGTFC